MNQNHTQTTPTQTLLEDPVTELTNLEQEISETFPGEIFDYPFILSPRVDSLVSLTTPLNARQIEILTKYNDFATTLFSHLGIPLDVPQKYTVFEKFLEFSRNIYLVRFVEARKLFAQYSLFAIPTEGAIEIATELGDFSENTLSMEINIPGTFVVDDNGILDFEKTVDQETKTNLIRSTISSFGNFIDLANKSIVDLMNITTRSFLISMNEQIILEIMQVVLQNLIIEVNKLVYNYLDRGYPPHESYENVRQLLITTTNKTGTKLPDALKHLQADTEKIIMESIKQNIKVGENVQRDLFTDIMELIVHYSTRGELVSKNLYKLKFVHYMDLPVAYEMYHHVVEVFLLDDFGDSLSVPSEAYDIDFSRESKEAMFRLVSNGFINPRLTLNDYLYRV